MNELLKSLLTADANSVLKLSPLLKTIRERLPETRRDELLLCLAQGGYSLVCSGSETILVGFRLNLAK